MFTVHYDFFLLSARKIFSLYISDGFTFDREFGLFWMLSSSEMLYSVGRFRIDVSGLRIGLIFKGKDILDIKMTELR
jgi:hypothetical protein